MTDFQKRPRFFLFLIIKKKKLIVRAKKKGFKSPELDHPDLTNNCLHLIRLNCLT